MGTAPNGYQTPKTNWQAANIVTPTDMNRIEGNIQAVEEGSRTIDPAQVPTSNVGSLRQFLDWFANRIKAITGKTNWYDAPSKTLEDLNTHMANTNNPHNTTYAQVGAAPATHTHTPSQISPQGTGSGLDADKLQGMYPTQLPSYDVKRSAAGNVIYMSTPLVSDATVVSNTVTLPANTTQTFTFTSTKTVTINSANVYLLIQAELFINATYNTISIPTFEINFLDNSNNVVYTLSISYFNVSATGTNVYQWISGGFFRYNGTFTIQLSITATNTSATYNNSVTFGNRGLNIYENAIIQCK